MWKTGSLFSCSTLCHLLYPSFLSVFCTLALLLSPLHIFLCFHLLFLYTLNPRQSVLTGVFFCLIPWETSISFLFPSQSVFLCQHWCISASCKLPSPPAKQEVDSNRLSAWLDSAEHLPFGYSWWLLPRSPQLGPVSLSVVAERVGAESANQPGIFHNCIFLPLEEYRFLFKED